jgi:mannose-6-phosphate isomerase-like protein (cupin superfamily)
MYDDIRGDLSGQFKDFPRKRIPRWGRAIKQLMEEKKSRGEDVSVQWISKQTGMNAKHLFNILAERVKDPASDKLVKISDVFGIPFSELAERAMSEYEGTCFVTGFNQRGNVEYTQHGFSIQSLSPPGTSKRDFFVGIMLIRPFKELNKWKFDSQSMVCIYVEAGTLEFTFGTKVQRIHSNESVYFDGGIPHKIRNIDSVEARLFIVTRPPLH